MPAAAEPASRRAAGPTHAPLRQLKAAAAAALLGAGALAAAPAAPATSAAPASGLALDRLLDAMVWASREDLAGHARVVLDKEPHPLARQALESKGHDPVTALPQLGIQVYHREVSWTFSGTAERVETTAPASEGAVLYTFDRGVGILSTEKHATVRPNRSQEFNALGNHPFGFGRPFFRLDPESTARLRAAMVDEGTRVEAGKTLRVLRYADPWRPLWHRLWVDVERDALVVREEEHFASGDQNLSRTMAVEQSQRSAAGREIATRVREELDYASGESGVEWFPLSLRTLELADLQTGMKVPASAFYHPLPPGIAVDNEVLGLQYVVGQRSLTEDAVFRLADRAPVPIGEAAAAGPGREDPLLDMRCGIYALLAASHLLGRQATLARIEQESGFRQAGSNMEGLRQAAHAIGLYASGFHSDLDTMERQHWQGIAQLDGNHFVLVLGVTPPGVTVLDLPSPPRIWSRQEFSARWSGVLLQLAAPRAVGRQPDPR